MKTKDMTPLVEDDFHGFSDGNTVVRIFNKQTGWYIGTYRYAKIKDGVCQLRLMAFMAFDRLPVQDLNPYDPGEVIFTKVDTVKGALRIKELPFRLPDPQKVVHQDLSLLIIHSEPEVAIISERSQDFKAVREIKEFAEFLRN